MVWSHPVVHVVLKVVPLSGGLLLTMYISGATLVEMAMALIAVLISTILVSMEPINYNDTDLYHSGWAHASAGFCQYESEAHSDPASVPQHWLDAGWIDYDGNCSSSWDDLRH